MFTKQDIELINENFQRNKRIIHNRNNIDKICVECGCQINESTYKVEDEVITESKTDCNGVIIHRGEKFVCIAVGLSKPSQNGKTGPMIQVYMIHSEIDPVTAQKTGDDATVCLQCIHRGKSCYVNPGQGVDQVFKSFKNGNYPELPTKNGIPVNESLWRRIFQGSSIRFGAYGEPVLIPLPTIELLTNIVEGRITGYTHAWRSHPDYKKFFMASVDTPQEYFKAKSMGWRTFRVSSSWHQKDADETFCKYNLDGTECIDCLKCRGNLEQDKNIFVKVHGPAFKTKRFIELMGKNDFQFPPMSDEERRIADELERKDLEAKKRKRKMEIPVDPLEQLAQSRDMQRKHTKIEPPKPTDYLEKM